MNKNKNRNKLGLVEFLLLVIAATLVVFVSYYIWHTQNQTDKVLNKPAAVAKNYGW